MNFLRVRRVHFVGIGGVGMSGLAEILSSVGLTVTGSDLREGEETLRLRALGIPVFAAGHRAEHVTGADVVVYSSAVVEDNPELVAARIAGVPVIKRAEMLAEVMRVKTGIAIAGSHGKTTTTSMTGSILQAAGLDPTIVVGGRVRAMGTNACLGNGELLVAEADEFDRSFLRLRPIVAVVNNIDLEHLDTYRDLDDLKVSFTQFASTVPFFGAALLGLDDPNVQEIRPLLASRVRVGTFGLTPQADVTARDLALERSGSRFTVVADGEVIGPVEVSLPGLHNVKNALAAIAVARELDVPFEACVKALATFAGVARRFERKGERDGVLVVDDYAHHPTEIAATLTAAMQGGHERVIAVFQPHLFSRTRYLQREFGRALTLADEAIVTEIFAAREEPEPGVSGKLIVDAYLAERPGGPVSFLPRLSDVVASLAPRVRPGDLVLTLGAGDVFHAGEQLLATLAGQGEEAAGAE
ncbi:MAG TPA: UDP-N-acetylmuramate--L-alanine ligase [Thermoanaerobaculia bacterium]|nr:UDP-N-acetylmuramate--L-alanine ligase [Thermoanaerobaculia bacterium]